MLTRRRFLAHATHCLGAGALAFAPHVARAASRRDVMAFRITGGTVQVYSGVLVKLTLKTEYPSLTLVAAEGTDKINVGNRSFTIDEGPFTGVSLQLTAHPPQRPAISKTVSLSGNQTMTIDLIDPANSRVVARCSVEISVMRKSTYPVSLEEITIKFLPVIHPQGTAP